MVTKQGLTVWFHCEKEISDADSGMFFGLRSALELV